MFSKIAIALVTLLVVSCGGMVLTDETASEVRHESVALTPASSSEETSLEEADLQTIDPTAIGDGDFCTFCGQSSVCNNGHMKRCCTYIGGHAHNCRCVTC